MRHPAHPSTPQITALLMSVPKLSQTAEASGNPSVAQAPTASEIIRRVEQNTDFKTAYYEARMRDCAKRARQHKDYESLVEGDDRALVEFTNKRDLGTRILKIEDDLWLFSPTAEEEVRLSGEMLNQGMMGSDFSYQDALRAHN